MHTRVEFNSPVQRLKRLGLQRLLNKICCVHVCGVLFFFSTPHLRKDSKCFWHFTAGLLAYLLEEKKIIKDVWHSFHSKRNPVPDPSIENKCVA